MDSDQNRASPNAALVRRICLTCASSLPIAGAAVSVMTVAGHRGVVSATDEIAQSLDDAQFTLGEGPGVDAFTTGRAVLVSDLDAPDGDGAGSWPVFRETAARLGVRMVSAFPLRLGAASLGTLSTYHLVPGALDGLDLARALRLADAAAVAVLDMIIGSDRDASAPRAVENADGEFYRVEIYQAAGMLTVQLGVTIEVAMMRLRSHAFAAERPIRDVARDIVRRKLRLETDTDRTADER